MFHSIRSKVLLAIISITIVTASGITLAFYFKSSGMVEENYGKNLYGRVEQMGTVFDNSLKEIYYITVQASCDQRLTSYINKYNKTKKVSMLEDIASILRSYKRRFSDIDSLYLLIPDSSIMVTSQDYPVYAKGIDNTQIQQAADLAEKSADPVMLSDPLSSSSRFLSFTDDVKGAKDNTLGYIMVNVDERTIYYKYLDNLYDKTATEAVILNNRDEIISTRDTDNIGTVYREEIFRGCRTNGVVHEKKEPNIGVLFHTSFTGYRFLMLANRNSVLKDMRDLRYYLFLLLLFAAAISIVPVYVITDKMYRPVKKLTDIMKRVGQGDLEVRAEIYTKDEIGILSENFNNMLEHINDLIEQLVHEETLKKDAELEALQYQITPHFMYNTLNSIKYSAYLKGEKELAGLIGDFVELLQTSINKMGTFITVSDEIHILQNYVNLQKFRHEGKFSVEYDISTEAEGCFLPRLILQPLVENSILHGIDLKAGGNRIIIRAKVEDKVLHLCVEDDGKGMTEEQIQELLTGKTKKTSGLSSIGISNVKERLHLYYGEKGGIYYQCEGKGTTAYLFLPAYKEQNKYTL